MTVHAEIACCIPTFNKFAYARRAALSFFKYTANEGVVYIVDDASPYWDRQDWKAWMKDLPEDRVIFKRFDKHGGLTRSWNFFLIEAKKIGVEYAVCGNSDILFTPHWADGLIHQVTQGGYSLVGPVSNAPGVTNGGKQRIENYYPGYQVTDESVYLSQVAEYCSDKYPVTQIVDCNINGFFMLARTQRWWDGRFNDKCVFDPSKAMTGNEDELQRRWHKQKFKTGFCPSSFIFHYRAVSRGDRFKHRGWHRIDDINKPV